MTLHLDFVIPLFRRTRRVKFPVPQLRSGEDNPLRYFEQIPVQIGRNGEHKKSKPNFNQASGKDFVVFEGTVLETVLVTRLNGDFSGPVICMLTNNIYSHDGQRLLIPVGTKLWVKRSGLRALAKPAWPLPSIGSSCRTDTRSIWISFMA